MMNKYLFVDYHNGHETTYHPFLSDIDLSNDDATKLQLQKHPESTRMGTNVNHIVNIIIDMGFTVKDYVHPEYNTKVHEIVKPDLIDWQVIEGISGNY